MADLTNGFVVTLGERLRPEDAEAVKQAILQLRCVIDGCTKEEAMERVPAFLEATAEILVPDAGREEVLDKRREELLRRPMPFALHEGACGLELLVPDDALKDIDEGELDDARAYAEEMDEPVMPGAYWALPELPTTELPFWNLGRIIPVGREFTYEGETYTWLGVCESYALTMDRIGPRVTLDFGEGTEDYRSVRVLDLEILAGQCLLVLEGNEVVLVETGGL